MSVMAYSKTRWMEMLKDATTNAQTRLRKKKDMQQNYDVPQMRR